MLISSLRGNTLAIVGVFSQHRERIRCPSWAGHAVSAGTQGNNFPEHVQNDDGASHKAGLPFVRERLMALVAVLAAGEAAVVVAA